MNKLKILKIKPVYYDSIDGLSLITLPISALIFLPLMGGVLLFETYFPVLPEPVAQWLLLIALVALVVVWIRVFLEYKRLVQIRRLLNRRSYGSRWPGFRSEQEMPEEAPKLDGPLDLSDFKSKFHQSAINERIVHSQIDEIDEGLIPAQSAAAVDLWGETAAFRLFDARSSSLSAGSLFMQVFLSAPLSLMPIKSAHRAYYHTVFEADLRGHIPHLFFVAKRPKGRRLKLDFSHLHKLEPDAYVSKFFDIYTPKAYALDALSAATPEVLEVLISLQNCDVEFIDDRLFCYAPLLHEAQLADFRQLGLKLHAKLNDNLRLRSFKKRESPFRQRLPRNPSRFIYAIAVLAFASLTLHIHSSHPPAPDDVADNRAGNRVIAHALTLIALFLVFRMLREYARNRKRVNQPLVEKIR